MSDPSTIGVVRRPTDDSPVESLGQISRHEPSSLRLVGALLLGAAVVAALFAVAILLGVRSGDSLHELAGAVLLLLLAPATWLALGQRRDAPDVAVRAAVAFAALLAMGTLGALLGLGVIPLAWGPLPLAPLALLLASSADGARRVLLVSQHPPN